MTKNLSYPLLTESPGKVCGSYFNVASGQTTHITMCSFSTPFKVIEKTYWGRVALVVDTKTITQTHRSIHKHIEVYTNTTQPMHITMCSFWTPFKVIEKTQNYTKTNTQTCFSLASPHKHPLIKYVSQIQVHTDANEAIGASPIPATDLDHSENNVSDIYTHMIDHWSDTFSFILKVSLNIICRLWLLAPDLDTRDSTWPTFRTPAKTVAKNTQRERQI